MGFPELLALTAGFLALSFARRVANAMNYLSIVFDNAFPQRRWPTALRPGSRESFENCLWFVRFLAVCVIALGLLPLIAGLSH